MARLYDWYNDPYRNPKINGQRLNDEFDNAALSGASAFLQAGTGAVTITVQDKLRQIINVKDFGARGDGVTDDTTAIQNAIDSSSAGATWDLTAGVFVFTTLTIDKPGILKGAGAGRMTTGTAPTELKTSSAGGGILITASGVSIEDLIVTSSVAAGSRTAAGIKLTTSAQRLYLCNVASNGHKYGFWIQQGIVHWNNTFADSNASHGYYLDGDLGTGVGELKFFDTWATNNGGEGYYFFGAVVGATMVGPVSQANTGAGIKIANSGANTVQDIYISHCEISANTANGIDVTSATNCTNFSVMGGVIETGGTYGIGIGQNVKHFSAGGGLDIHGFGTGILANGGGGTFGPLKLSNNSVADFELGANSSNYSLVGVVGTTVFGTSPIGLKVTAGASVVVIAACVFNNATTPLSGTMPTNSWVAAVRGIASNFNGTNINGNLTVSGFATAIRINGQVDINGVTDYAIGAIGSTNSNKQVWFGFDTTNDRGFMQAIIQGTGFKPMLINPLGANVVIGSSGNGSYNLDLTGTFGATSTAAILNATAIPAGGTAGSGYLFSSTANFGTFFGSGAPTLSAAQGSHYYRSDGGTFTRAYVNTDGSTGWSSLPVSGDIGTIRYIKTGINFNSANTDNSFTVTLPAGISRYRVGGMFISNASASISTATAGVFTGAGATGQTMAATQALTVTASAADTNNNMMLMTGTNGNTMAYTDTTVFFRVVNAQGSAATADFIFDITPLT